MSTLGDIGGGLGAFNGVGGGLRPLASVGGGLGDALAEIATALRVPVLLAAVIVLLLCAFELGRFGAEVLRRRRARQDDLAASVAAAIADPGNVAGYAWRAPSGFAERAVFAIVEAVSSGGGASIEHALGDYELEVQRRLDRTRILVRAGPAIGLMGTLIPLAPGLAALGAGDVAQLADDLRDALAATVVGLLVGTIAFGLTLTRTRMYTEDLSALERGVESSTRAGSPTVTGGVEAPGTTRAETPATMHGGAQT